MSGYFCHLKGYSSFVLYVFMCVFSMKNSVYICTYTYVFKYLCESNEMLYVKQNGPGLLLPVFWALLVLAWTELILKSHDHLLPKSLITVPEWKLKVKSCFNEHHFTEVLPSIIMTLMTLNTLVVFFFTPDRLSSNIRKHWLCHQWFQLGKLDRNGNKVP